MKKRLLIAVVLVCSFAFLTGCGKKVNNSKELETYKASMENFFKAMEKENNTINSIDPESQNSMTDLLKEFDHMETFFKQLSELTVPTENVPETFVYIPDLAIQASDYMTQANDYMHQAFSESSYNENTFEVAMECYKRANKRIGYIITLLNGEYPQDETITYNNQ